jgi:hypothetical protein
MPKLGGPQGAQGSRGPSVSHDVQIHHLRLSLMGMSDTREQLPHCG